MSSGPAKQEWLAAARAAMEIEAAAVSRAAARLGGELIAAVEVILAHPGKVVVTGIGKSGHIARKIVATLCSTGTASVFLHPAEAVHGDLGIYTPGDATVLISKNGTSAELLALAPLLRQFHSPLIGILGNRASPLAAQMDVLLDASLEREADPDNLAPTASAVTALAMGHALAIALMCARNFTPEEFGRLHPGGALAGFLTDGDLRRALTTHDDIRGLCAEDVMTRTPVTIGPEASLGEALERMERRRSQISVLPVVDEAGRALGLIRLHDIYLGSR